ncbi:methyltransferase domain-containing protein [Cryobacterium sp. TMT1-21]|uniref:Methyltransferase domain-containing protein n=1 Tax=Cryobacterium shii TaxID=1259235 RepID=A0AAQ2C3T7_9MICO|nr:MULTISPECIES: methyltransferase [Cryobacterium]TFC40782.1 methyltransferase domain-containing protein [Cryobacterium shii]TFC82870.1 methyltransferase domain-containing protein [Cryobacterium sp. TmT2-59]TFD11362.1 methyltransferase domain-containing protein [Cryobacterium sp. TMT4-10]TFD14137.1 methyltransferase domain-containing protein [Cryobacterium sp. TMT1-21]TFD23461.1 methyltransferase domain-containing protein [Cryobacterium sp. TMT2-23]
MSDFSFDRLRRYPDVEADNLFAVDASDRLILDQAADALGPAEAGEVVVLEDKYGALTLGAAALAAARDIRVHQDALSGELALARNAAEAGLSDRYRSLELGEDLLVNARVVLMQLPRSLAALDELAAAIARFAAPDVVVIAGGRIKHMTTAMNEVLSRHFGSVSVSPARQKSRVLTASVPLLAATDGAVWPQFVVHADLGLTVSAHGAAFAGTTIDIGTRYLLEFLDRMKPDAQAAIDLGCGTGVIAAALARRRPRLCVIATDQSAAAVASARATMAANELLDQVTVVRDDALSSQPDASAELIVLNPPFHIGSSVHAGIALKLFDDAGRVLRPDGELWTVWNTHLGYRPALTRLVGTTHQVGRNSKFTVTVSTRR